MSKKNKYEMKKEEMKMQELQLTNQMEIIGGGVGTWIVCVVVGAAVYKMLYSSSGRISIPRLVSIEWR